MPEHRCRSRGAACLWPQCTWPFLDQPRLAEQQRRSCPLDRRIEARGQGFSVGGFIPRYAQLWLAILSSASEPMLNISTLASRYTLHTNKQRAPESQQIPAQDQAQSGPSSRCRKLLFSREGRGWGRAIVSPIVLLSFFGLVDGGECGVCVCGFCRGGLFRTGWGTWRQAGRSRGPSRSGAAPRSPGCSAWPR